MNVAILLNIRYYILTIDNMTTYCHNSKLQLFFITLMEIMADLTSMKMISFCTATLACVDNGTVPYIEYKNKTLITDI